MAAPKKNEEATLGLPVKLAFLHQAISVMGIINTERTLSKDKVPGIEMNWTPEGLLIAARGMRCIVPAANVAVAVLAE